ncbi:MAG TPA: PLP-dependent aminotransferase family protein [Solirubrobacteraceae bacterium]|nr:PLP-dependent aminotransferase family protein [Solirubrobacteraceae bacterium]
MAAADETARVTDEPGAADETPADEAAGREGAAGDLLVGLDPARPEPLRRQLAGELREAIRGGRLRTGVRLPASRALAAQLGVSRGVVTDAYEQLTAEGWLAARRGAGTVVAAAPAAEPAPSEPPRRATVRFDFTPTTPDVSLFPRRQWARAVAHAAADAPDSELDYGSGFGSGGLREALAGYLGRVRGTAAEPGNIVVCAGYSQATRLLFTALAERGVRRVGLEDPSLTDHWDAAAHAGLEAAPIPLDGDGLRVDALAASGAEAVVVTPSHQFPTGAVMGPQRRHALLAWARAGDRIVIEDDYDAEFRYDRRPLAALQGLDPARVAYVGTASKTLAPALRLGWILAPAALAPALAVEKLAADSGSPALDQLALAHMIASGEHDRHLRRVRRTYAERRDRLVAALARAVPEGRIEGAAAGVHLVLALPVALDPVRLRKANAAHGVVADDIGARRHGPSPRGPTRLVLGYGRVPTAGVDAAVAGLAAALRDAGM